jgi:NAD(P)H-hydrate epimerase
MEPVLTSAGMKALDRYAVKALGIPSFALMENAGKGVADALIRRYGDPAGKKILVFCGKGNNGGDGLVAARHLLGKGAEIGIVMMADPVKLHGDAKKNYKILKKLLADCSLRGATFFRWRSSREPANLPRPDIVVDAIFGTGFSGNVTGGYKSAIEWINTFTGKIVSIDIPSGLNGDDGTVRNVAVRASYTITMGYRKTGLILNDGMTYTGTVEVVDIGLPQFLRKRPVGDQLLLESRNIREWLPVRSSQSHKHSVGKVLIAAGSRGFTGAPSLTSVASMRSGAGSAILAVPASVHPVLARKVREVIVLALPESGDGSFSPEAYEELAKRFSWADVLAVGPGLSTSEGARELVYNILGRCALPLVLDADALNIIAGNPRLLLRRRSQECILTPHIGEFSRLTGVAAAEIAGKRITLASEFARKYRLTLVLKGSPTIIASEEGGIFLNPTGNPGMATAGSGDVLTGMIAGLWAQGMGRVEAACSAVYLHGLAGDLARGEFGERGLMAGDIEHKIPAALARVSGGVRA